MNVRYEMTCCTVLALAATLFVSPATAGDNRNTTENIIGINSKEPLFAVEPSRGEGLTGRIRNEAALARIQEQFANGGGNTDSTTPVTVGVPEPSSVLMLALGSVALLFVGMRKKVVIRSHKRASAQA